MLPVTHLGKVVGHLRADHTFITRRKPIHFFRKFQGFGLSFAVIKQLRAKGCLLVCLIYTNNYNEESIYFTTPENIIDKGMRYTDKEADNQLILPLKEWHAHTLTFPMEN